MSCLSPVSVNVTCRTATTVAATCSTSAEVVATCRANGLYENTEQEETYEATCPAGHTGTPVSATVNVPAGTFFSTVSTLDADNQATSFALAQATSLAEASIVCVLSFGNVALSETVTIRCPTGSEGDSVTETASVDANIYTSNVSQAEADAIAREAAVEAATQLALPQLTCLVTYQNDDTLRSYTATCPSGEEGEPSVGYGHVAAGVYSSSISKATANALARTEADILAEADAEAGLSCTIIPFFADYLVIRFVWADGTDLDTRTALVDTGSSVDGKDAGWGASRYTTVDLDGLVFLTWGGDNVGNPGNEATFVDYLALKEAFPSASEFHLRIRCNWYGNPDTGNFVLSGTTYTGGAMVQVGTDFVNVGGVETGISTTPLHCTSHESADVDGEDMATVIFNVLDSTVSILPI